MIGFNPECVKMIGQCMLAKMANRVVTNPHFDREQVQTPTSGDLFPFLPKYPQFEDMPELAEGSVQIPTYIRYG